MLKVIICDENQAMVDRIKSLIESHIFIEEIKNVEIELATTNPQAVLDLFVEKKNPANEKGKKTVIKLPLQERLLFLDINLGIQSPKLGFDGLDLAKEIREYDIASSLAFITNPLFEQKDIINTNVMPLACVNRLFDEIQMNEFIIDLLKLTRKRLKMPTATRIMLEFPTGRGVFKHVKLDEVCYVQGNESKNKGQNSDKIQSLSILYTLSGAEPLSRKLKIYEEKIPNLIKLGRSYLVNPNNIDATYFTASKVRVLMKNGDELCVNLASYESFEKILNNKKM